MQDDSTKRRVSTLEHQLTAVKAVSEVLASSIGLESVFVGIIPQVSLLMKAERSSLLLYDAHTEELWSQVLQGEETLVFRLPLGQGIAGWVAKHGKRVNIPDAYQDERFNQAVDVESGFRTREVACVPLNTREGALLGVLQVLNHTRGGAFDEDDMALLEVIAVQVGHAVENATLSQKLLDKNQQLALARSLAERRSDELDLLYGLEQDAANAPDLDSLMTSVLRWTGERVKCSQAMVSLVAPPFHTFYVRVPGAEGNSKLLKETLKEDDANIAKILESGEFGILNARELASQNALEARCQSSFDSMGVAPLTHDGQLLGALMVMNPAGSTPNLYAATQRIVQLIAAQVARSITTVRGRAEQAETDRLAGVGRMLAGVAHDLRNPMTAMSGYAQIIASEDDPEERLFFSQKMVRNIHEMTAMVNDVLAYSRGDFTLKPSLVELRLLGDQLQEALGPLCEDRRISLTLNVERSVVSVDLAKTKRIILNLGKNAADAQCRGGSVTIDLQSVAGSLRAIVSDTGPGLPAIVLENLFRPIMARSDGGGTGLGLSIVKRFVDDHHGQIEVDTSAAGTTFKITLPRAETVDATEISK